MKRKYLILFSLSGLILACDQLAKHLVRLFISMGEVVPVLPPLVSLVHRQNGGFVFGTLQNIPASLQDVFFIGVPVFALILIVLIFIKLQDDQVMTSIALTTILAGAVGNLIDRIQHGFVIDFVSLSVGNVTSFPPFNIADCSILLGVTIMFINTLFHAKIKTDSVSVGPK